MTDHTASAVALSADGMPLKRSLNRALRRQKLRAFVLIAPLLVFVLFTFLAPIGDMLFRSVENQIVSETLPPHRQSAGRLGSGLGRATRRGRVSCAWS